MITYGPIDLTGATSAYMKFTLWLNTQPYRLWNPVYGMYVGDGLIFSANTYSEWMSFPWNPGDVMGSTYGWKDMILNLADLDGSHRVEGNLLNKNNVYIYFGFSSDGSEVGLYPEGVYMDDILIKKCIGGTCPLDW